MSIALWVCSLAFLQGDRYQRGPDGAMAHSAVEGEIACFSGVISAPIHKQRHVLPFLIGPLCPFPLQAVRIGTDVFLSMTNGRNACSRAHARPLLPPNQRASSTQLVASTTYRRSFVRCSANTRVWSVEDREMLRA